jgi:hypothetical protein
MVFEELTKILILFFLWVEKFKVQSERRLLILHLKVEMNETGLVVFTAFESLLNII